MQSRKVAGSNRRFEVNFCLSRARYFIILLAGDEAALPAIARIAAEAPAGTRMTALIEVEDEAEEQALVSQGALTVRWLHRKDYPSGASAQLAEAIRTAIEAADDETFIWVACEKEDVRAIRSFLKRRGHDRKRKYVAWYWEREGSNSPEERASTAMPAMDSTIA